MLCCLACTVSVCSGLEGLRLRVLSLAAACNLSMGDLENRNVAVARQGSSAMKAVHSINVSLFLFAVSSLSNRA